MKKKIILGSIALVLVGTGIFGISSQKNKDGRLELSPKKAARQIYGKAKLTRLETSEVDKLGLVKTSVKEVYNVSVDKDKQGKALVISQMGAKGDMNLMIGFDNDGTIVGVRVLNNQETPSIGGKVASSDFTEEFKGNKIEEELEVDTISRATKTSEAIIKGVEEGKQAYKQAYK